MSDVLEELDKVISQRASEPGDSYTQRLLADRNLRLKKIGEEAAEFVLSCADKNTSAASEEAADIIYHVLVALHGAGGHWNDVAKILKQRANQQNQ